MTKRICFLLLLGALVQVKLPGQCSRDSIGPNELDYVSARRDHSIYFGITDFIYIKDLGCVNKSKFKTIQVKAITNCIVEPVIPPFPVLNTFDTSTVHIRLLTFASCDVEVRINDTVIKKITFYPKTIPPPRVYVASDGTEIDFRSIATEAGAVSDYSSSVIMWQPLQYTFCIINNGKMVFSGQAKGEVISPQMKQAIANAPKGSFFFFSDIDVESRPGICYKKETYHFAYAITQKN